MIPLTNYDYSEVTVRSLSFTQILLYILVGGFNPSEKYELISWDDDISNIWNKIHVPNHQPVYIYSDIE